jgi:zinc transport system substrate-binding protein
VGGEYVDVTVLVPEGASPHTYELTPSTVVKAESAEMWVKNGVGLEFWAEKVMKVNDDITIIDASQGVELIDVNGGYDPHIWLSLDVARNAVDAIAEGLAGLDPEHAEHYRANRDAYIERLDTVDGHIRSTLQDVDNKMFIAYHSAWSYFARDYGLTQIAIEQEGKEPTPQHLASVIEIARDNDIHVIFVEPQFSPDDANTIAEEIDGSVLSINPLARSYADNMEDIAETLREGMGGG